jgi:hypothetical protein
MKTTRLTMVGALASILLITSCERSKQDVNSTNNNTVRSVTEENAVSGKQRPHNGECNPYAYTVDLESVTPLGNYYEWVWSVTNSNPGNGGNGTVQDLSHWGMQFGPCFQWSSIVEASYSGDGVNWTSFTPSFQTDPSQNCMTTPVLKFDFGTTGANKSYYKVLVSSSYAVGMVPAYYKSGSYTGCCTFQFEGIGCTTDVPTGER